MDGITAEIDHLDSDCASAHALGGINRDKYGPENQ
jgi:hypothetical protein